MFFKKIIGYFQKHILFKTTGTFVDTNMYDPEVQQLERKLRIYRSLLAAVIGFYVSIEITIYHLLNTTSLILFSLAFTMLAGLAAIFLFSKIKLIKKDIQNRSPYKVIYKIENYDTDIEQQHKRFQY